MKKDQNIVTKQSIKDSDSTKLNKVNSDTNLKPPNKEIGGQKGLEPTRYGDWEKNGRCIDF